MSLRGSLGSAFSSLSVPNYRRWFVGQAISLIGTWMQTTAQSWLVLTLTHSATDLGIVVALQTLPMLVLGPYGGVVADRVDKRRLMVVLQSMMGVQALVLGLLTLTHHVNYPEVCVLAVVLGLNNCFENPSRQAFVLEMVGQRDLRNAVSLNSTLVNAARAVGPAVAGVLIATVGVGWCFVLNAGSFVAVVTSLLTMDRTHLQPSKPTSRRRGQLREGFRYVARTPQLGLPLLMMALVGMLAYEFQVTLPVYAKGVFHGGAETFGAMTAAMGAGAVIGGLVTAARGRTGLRALILAAGGFGVAIAFAAASPVLAVAFVALALVGYGSVSFLSMANSTLQLATDPQMRGRVMALWSVAFQGSTPIGGPVIGWVTAASGARAGLGVGAGSCFVAAGLGIVAARRLAARAARPAVEVIVSEDAAPGVATTPSGGEDLRRDDHAPGDPLPGAILRRPSR
ncbi:MAG TPA: MFS transporter [Acidimicrobiales bacterium]